MRKYQFSNSLMFAIVMHDPTACRGFIEKLFPERKVKAIYFPGEDGEMQETESKSLQDAVHAAAAGVGVEKQSLPDWDPSRFVWMSCLKKTIRCMILNYK